MVTQNEIAASDPKDKTNTRRLVIRIAGMTAGFFLFLIFLGWACFTTTMDSNNNVHANHWLLAIAFFWACVFIYHTAIS